MRTIHSLYSAWFIGGATMLLLSGGTAVSAPHLPAAEWRTEKVVMVMRHGVRSGLTSESVTNYSQFAWPDFGVAAGELTPHGRTAMMLWGEYHRRRLAQQGLLPTHGLIAPNTIRAFASPMTRNLESAEAFLQGLAPATPVEVSAASTRPWFRPNLNGLLNADQDSMRQAIEEGLGMPLPQAATYYKPLIAGLESRFGIRDGTVSLLPWEIQMDDEGPYIPALKLMNGMVETVRMQYGNNLPLEQVGFGSIRSQAALADLMALRTISYNAMRHPRFFAVRHGAPLLERLLECLSDESGELISLYMGHDTNLASLRSLLGFNWHMPEHARNDTNPGAMLMFERLHHLPSGERFLRVSYHAPTMDQIRNLHPFDDAMPPFMTVHEPRVSDNATDANHRSLWPLHDFATLVAEAVHEAASDARNVTTSITPSATLPAPTASRVSGQATLQAPNVGPASHNRPRFPHGGTEPLLIDSMGRTYEYGAAGSLLEQGSIGNPFAR